MTTTTGLYLPAEVISAELTPYELAAYVAIARHINRKTGAAFPSYSTIAKESRMSRTKAIESVAGLVAKSLLQKETRTKETPRDKVRNTSNLYTLPSRQEDQDGRTVNQAWSQSEPERKEKRPSSFEPKSTVTKNKRLHGSRSVSPVISDPEAQERRTRLSAMFYGAYDNSSGEHESAPQLSTHDQSTQEIVDSNNDSKFDLFARLKQIISWNKAGQKTYAASRQESGKLTIVAPEPLDEGCMETISRWRVENAPDLRIEIVRTA